MCLVAALAPPVRPASRPTSLMCLPIFTDGFNDTRHRCHFSSTPHEGLKVHEVLPEELLRNGLGGSNKEHTASDSGSESKAQPEAESEVESEAGDTAAATAIELPRAVCVSNHARDLGLTSTYTLTSLPQLKYIVEQPSNP